MVKSARPKMYTQQMKWPILVIIESCFAAWPLIFSLVIMIRLSHNTTKGKFKELTCWSERAHYWFEQLLESLGAITKQLQVPFSTVQTIVCKYKEHGTVVSLPWSERNANCCCEKFEQDGQESTKKQVCNEWEAAGRCQCMSSMFCIAMGWEAAAQERSTLLQMGHLRAWWILQKT